MTDITFTPATTDHDLKALQQAWQQTLTSAGLAYWEIGLMNDQYLQIIKASIDNGEGVRVWGEEVNHKEGRARAGVLNRFWKKINQVNTNPRKPKKYEDLRKLGYF